MTDLLKKFIEDNINLIEEYKFDELFSKASLYAICSDVTSVLVNANIEFLRFISKIQDYMFNNVNVTDVVLPNNIKKIGDAGFWQCPSLQSITIPESATNIGVAAFQECHGLTTIRLPEGLDRVNNFLFHYCKNLISVELPSTIKSIGDHAFSDCKKLESIILPEGVTYIYEGAFARCASLKTIVLPTTLSYISDAAFHEVGARVLNYNGTKAEWTRVKKARGWRSSPLTVVCSNGEMSYN